MAAPFAELPTELYEAIFSHVAYPDLQQVVLAVTRAIPLSAVPLQGLFESIRVTRPQQAFQVYRRLRQRPTNHDNEGGQAHPHQHMGAGRWVRSFSIETWDVDADVVVNIMPFLPRLHSLTIRVGPKNFAPEHLEEIFTTPMPSLRSLSLQFKPYVEKATYYQFLKGAYFDSTLVALSRWPPGRLSTISIVQEPLPAEEKQIKRDFAQPIVFFRLDLSVLLKSYAISESLESLRVRIPLRPIARALFNSSPLNPVDSIIVPNLEFLDISTCGVLEGELDTILSRFVSLKHLVADNCSLLRGDLREGEGHNLGKRCALLGVRRAKDREKALKAWFEARALAKTAGGNGQVPTAGSRVRAPKKGRKGLATATISFRDPPLVVPSATPASSTVPSSSSGFNPSNPPGMRFGKPVHHKTTHSTTTLSTMHESVVPHLASTLAQTSITSDDTLDKGDHKGKGKKHHKRHTGKNKAPKPQKRLPQPNEKIRVLPCIPLLATISIKLASSVAEDRYEAIRADFKEGWKEGIAQLTVTRARMRTSAKNGFRIMRIGMPDAASDRESDSGNDTSSSGGSSGSSSNELKAGLYGLEDIDVEDLAAFDVPTGETGVALPPPVLCFAGPGASGNHEQNCGHSVGHEVMGDDL